MATFDWVTARAQCSAIHVFKQLEFGAAEDVAVANSVQSAGNIYVFGVVGNSGNMFSVVRQVRRSAISASSAPEKTVDFYLEDDRIVVRRGIQNEQITATLTLDDEGRCKLRVGERVLDQWQFRRLALESLLFETT
jgi:hypothetical protein